jgi:hypothetical protein
MGYPTKVQRIQRQKGVDQWLINFPTAVAQAMDFVKGEVVEWTLIDKAHLILSRQSVPPDPVEFKKNANPLKRLPTTLGQVRADLFPATQLRTGAAPPPEPAGLPGAPYRQRLGLHLRPSV